MPAAFRDLLKRRKRRKSRLPKRWALRTAKTPPGSRVVRRELLAHMFEKRPDARERFANYALPTLEQPFEIRLKQHEDGNLRENSIRLFREARYSLPVVVRTNRDGSLVWNMMNRKDRDMDRLREGLLAWSIEKES